MTDELSLLLRSLNAERTHVLGTVEGLSDEQLRRRVLASGWTCLGLVNHLAVDVERFWFRAVVADEPGIWAGFDENAPSAWEVDATAAGDTVLAVYRDEVRRADEIITATPLDSEPAAWPDFFGDFRLPNLRAVVLHVLRETACHAGHLDAVREILDGRQWMVV
jgi:uncharacterized damage-inducible protein DinB